MQALKILLEKMGKEKLIDGEIHLGDETLEQTLERIAISHNMTVEELLVENNILKDDNSDNLPDKKIERLGRKKGHYKELSSDNNANENGKAEEDRMSNGDGDESLDEGSNHREEEAENIEEKPAKAMDPMKSNEWEETKTTWKDYLPMEEEEKKNEKEAANFTAQIAAAANDTDPIAVAADHALQEDSIENMEE
eukprot:jgi/Psemu1/17747/gm1.17747_g